MNGSPPPATGRLGILGGTFDPVHSGHLAVAEAVLRGMALAGVLFVPAFQPPHKPGRTISSFAHRAAMLELALTGRAGFSLSRLEAERGGPSYSIDTLRALSSSLDSAVRLFFIIGMDAFAEISTWKDHALLLDHASLVVVGRPDQCGEDCGVSIARAYPGYVFNPAAGCWQGGRQGTIHALAMEPVPISSSQVREVVRQGGPLAGLVPETVADYIRRQGLYGFRPGAGKNEGE